MELIIYETLQPFGAIRQYKGCRQLVAAINIVLEDPKQLEYVTAIYQNVADQFECSHISVERNIRTLIKCFWDRNPEYLSELAGHTFSKPPSSSQFLDIIAFYIWKEHPKCK